MEAEDYPGTGAEPPEDFLMPVWDRYQAIRLVSIQATTTKAEAVVKALQTYAFGGGRWEEVEHTRDQYLAAIREEFHLPPISLMGD